MPQLTSKCIGDPSFPNQSAGQQGIIRPLLSPWATKIDMTMRSWGQGRVGWGWDRELWVSLIIWILSLLCYSLSHLIKLFFFFTWL